MALIRPFPGVLATLCALMQRASRERRILPGCRHDDMQEMHLVESYLISTPPLLIAPQRRPPL